MHSVIREFTENYFMPSRFWKTLKWCQMKCTDKCNCMLISVVCDKCDSWKLNWCSELSIYEPTFVEGSQLAPYNTDIFPSWMFDLFPLNRIDSTVSIKPHYLTLSICRGIFSPTNSEQTPQSSPVRAGYGVCSVRSLFKCSFSFLPVVSGSISCYIRRRSIESR